jgi:uncharacterized protein
MLLEFDEGKSTKNVEGRGIGFERFADIDAETAISGEDVRKDYGERRLRVLGFIDGVLHAAVVTPRGEMIRVISLRRANRREERAYAKRRESS